MESQFDDFIGAVARALVPSTNVFRVQFPDSAS